MQQLIIRRLLTSLVVVWAVATIVFFAMRVVPADPAEVVLGDQATAQSLAAFRERAGLNRPLWEQYAEFMTSAVHGDLGRSLITDVTISSQIIAVFPYTLALTVAALAIGGLIGIPVGVVAAIKRNTWIDTGSRIFALMGFSFPAFYLGITLLLIFSLWLGWFPIVHSIRLGTLQEHLHKLLLPALTLGLIEAAYIMRITRSTMLEELRKDYVRTAHAKGLERRRVYFLHALKNALIPVITAMGLSTGSLLGGAILTETVFNRPGLGRLLIGAIEQRDYTLIQGGLIVFACVIVLLNTVIDIVYRLVDPRVKYG